ncbi:MAG TPA: hypothetical protein DCL61_17345 [Cyanobacteria bacterium UBA12227]|nr:hypothetical protein [Cyanobacteria bacterium UBA12227]HAX88940.1 hypothetical protein [Cyanobacteria bacterium UBA11370]HBY76772.1 hypothetical protein [Cyanobacteria bacterium UBA11148]
MISADSQLRGMISRTRFFEWLSRPYGLETFLKRPIRSLWKMIAEAEGILDAKTLLEKYLILSTTCTIDKAVELALNRSTSLAYEPILIESPDGEHRLLDMQVLLLAQSQLFALAKNAADAANRTKSEFLTNMSHELRTPLNAILGITQLLTRDPSLSAEQQQHLGIITSSGEYLLDLINHILEMSRIETARVTLNKNRFDLYRLLNNLKQILQLKALSKGLKLIVDYTPDLPQYVETDKGKLEQVLINLLNNAINFTQQGSVSLKVSVVRDELSVENENKQQTIRFEVKDTGFGIAPEEINALFSAFEQTKIGRESKQGTGLGLAISQNFVQLMGGKITVKSTLNKGTVFTFDIKINRIDDDEIKTSEDTCKVIGLAPDQLNYRILVVEDHPESRLFLVKLLKSIGFCVHEAENGQEAVELRSSYLPHLILMNMRMPVMDGYEASKRIRSVEKFRRSFSTEPVTVIIALTASAFEEDYSKILSAGCDDFIYKPFREAVLLDKIAHHLGVRYLYKE